MCYLVMHKVVAQPAALLPEEGNEEGANKNAAPRACRGDNEPGANGPQSKGRENFEGVVCSTGACRCRNHNKQVGARCVTPRATCSKIKTKHKTGTLPRFVQAKLVNARSQALVVTLKGRHLAVRGVEVANVKLLHEAVGRAGVEAIECVSGVTAGVGENDTSSRVAGVVWWFSDATRMYVSKLLQWRGGSTCTHLVHPLTSYTLLRYTSHAS